MTDRRLTAQAQAGEFERREEPTIAGSFAAALANLSAAETLLRAIPGCEPSADVVMMWRLNIEPNLAQIMLSVERNATPRPLR